MDAPGSRRRRGRSGVPAPPRAASAAPFSAPRQFFSRGRGVAATRVRLSRRLVSSPGLVAVSRRGPLRLLTMRIFSRRASHCSVAADAVRLRALTSLSPLARVLFSGADITTSGEPSPRRRGPFSPAVAASPRPVRGQLATCCCFSPSQSCVSSRRRSRRNVASRDRGGAASSASAARDPLAFGTARFGRRVASQRRHKAQSTLQGDAARRRQRGARRDECRRRRHAYCYDERLHDA